MDGKHRQPRYADAVASAGLRGLADGSVKPGSVYVVQVRHDDWCQLLKGIGPCNCTPEVGAPERVAQPTEN